MSRFGCPAVVTTDRGRQFQSALFNALAAILGVRHIHTTSYHPSANGMVERLHRQLKAALTTYEPREHWADHLPLVLLGLRSAFKADLHCTSAELVYGCPLRLPGDLLTPPPADGPSDPAGYVADLRRLFEQIRPVLPRQRSDHSVFVSQDLSSCTHVFVRHDAARRPLTPAFDGPYRVIERHPKTFTLDINGRQDVVAADRVKPAYLASLRPNQTFPVSTTMPRTLHHQPSKTVTWSSTTASGSTGGSPVAARVHRAEATTTTKAEPRGARSRALVLEE